MIVLRDQNTEQTFRINANVDANALPLSGVIFSFQSATTTIEVEGSLLRDGFRQQATITVDLSGESDYDLTVRNGSTVIYKDTVFVTSLNIDTYSINDGQFVYFDSMANAPVPFRPGQSPLDVDQDVITFTDAGGMMNLQISATGSWTASDNVDWLTFTTSGTGDTTLTITATQNPGEFRTGTLQIVQDGLTRNVRIDQLENPIPLYIRNAPDNIGMNGQILKVDNGVLMFAADDSGSGTATQARSFRFFQLRNPDDSSAGQVSATASEQTITFKEGDNIQLTASGQEITFDVADTNLTIDNAGRTGTVLTLRSSTGSDVQIPVVSTTDAGIMIATDKVKLNSITNIGSGQIITDDERTLIGTISTHTHTPATLRQSDNDPLNAVIVSLLNSNSDSDARDAIGAGVPIRFNQNGDTPTDFLRDVIISGNMLTFVDVDGTQREFITTSLTVEDEGNVLTGVAEILNFTGTGVQVRNAGNNREKIVEINLPTGQTQTINFEDVTSTTRAAALAAFETAWEAGTPFVSKSGDSFTSIRTGDRLILTFGTGGTMFELAIYEGSERAAGADILTDEFFFFDSEAGITRAVADTLYLELDGTNAGQITGASDIRSGLGLRGAAILDVGSGLATESTNIVHAQPSGASAGTRSQTNQVVQSITTDDNGHVTGVTFASGGTGGPTVFTLSYANVDIGIGTQTGSTSINPSLNPATGFTLSNYRITNGVTAVGGGSVTINSNTGVISISPAVNAVDEVTINVSVDYVERMDATNTGTATATVRARTHTVHFLTAQSAEPTAFVAQTDNTNRVNARLVSGGSVTIPTSDSTQYGLLYLDNATFTPTFDTTDTTRVLRPRFNAGFFTQPNGYAGTIGGRNFTMYVFRNDLPTTYTITE